jgi:hypothetical protein
LNTRLSNTKPAGKDILPITKGVLNSCRTLSGSTQSYGLVRPAFVSPSPAWSTGHGSPVAKRSRRTRMHGSVRWLVFKPP